MTNNGVPKWILEFDNKALKQAKKIDRKTLIRIRDFLENRVAILEDPRTIGKPMLGEYSDYWRYRVGDYRIMCKIYENTITIMVMKIGHRREVYR